jgi:type I restriction enzyme S subunit
VTRIEELAAKIAEARLLRHEAATGAAVLVSAAESGAYRAALRISGKADRLEDLCIRITDGTHVTPHYVDEGVPFISVKDITGGKICLDSARRISREEHAVLTKRSRPERGDILLTKIGTIGLAKVVDIDEEFSIFVSLALLKLKHDRVLPRFIEHMLNSTIIRDQALADTRGVGNQNLVLKFIREFNIPTPPLCEQRRIVVELDAVKAKVDGLERLQGETAVELDALLPSVLSRAFAGEL